MQNPDWIFGIPIGKCKIPIGFLESRSGNSEFKNSVSVTRSSQDRDRAIGNVLPPRQQLEVVGDYFM
jgi:hypothetical protein